jgi:hypothetical protein
MVHTQASNAIVSLCNYYATAIGDLLQQLQAKEEIIKQLGAQLKTVSTQPKESLRSMSQTECALIEVALDWYALEYDNATCSEIEAKLASAVKDIKHDYDKFTKAGK